jgi:hypothetical protein
LEDDYMAKITIALAAALTLLGLGTYFGSSDANPSKTALIPAVFGVLLLGCGLAALQPTWRKHAMHVAVTGALLGALAASGRGVMALAKLAGGGDVNRIAFGSVLLMAAICWLLVALCVNSFIAARRRQAAASKSTDSGGE